jgi:hypothetical protein
LGQGCGDQDDGGDRKLHACGGCSCCSEFERW